MSLALAVLVGVVVVIGVFTIVGRMIDSSVD